MANPEHLRDSKDQEALAAAERAPRRCFIAAGAGADFSAIQSALERGGWETYLITDVPVRAASLRQ